MLSHVTAATIHGLEAIPVETEVDINRGLFVFSIVGLPTSSVSEARTRVRSALINCGYGFPAGRVTVNLAPAFLRKDGTDFDLAIALGILRAQGLLNQVELGKTIFVGELSLDGRLRPVRAVLPLALSARASGYRRLIIPFDNLSAMPQIDGLEIYGAQSLVDVVEFLLSNTTLAQPDMCSFRPPHGEATEPEIGTVRGQAIAKRALEISAAGGHNLLLSGPPGSGKSMISECIISILPQLNFDAAMESAAIESIAGVEGPNADTFWKPPFRAPHHSISDAGLIGGGRSATPGEISLAHHGVLFLDELPEFRRTALEALRQPIETGRVTIARAERSVEYPASFILIGAMNPCPCGFTGHPHKHCRCHPNAIERYQQRLSGPLLDRFDLMVNVAPVSIGDLGRNQEAESSSTVAARVAEARRRQYKRNSNNGVGLNSQLSTKSLHALGGFDADALVQFARVCDKFSMSARGFYRCLRVARTIADLAYRDAVGENDLYEALQYRPDAILKS